MVGFEVASDGEMVLTGWKRREKFCPQGES